jgi:hypothetical protein
MRPSTWTLADIQWKRHCKGDGIASTLSSTIALQGSYAEETGMLVAARLAQYLSERSARLIFAQQSADESKHSRALELYAETRHIEPVSPTIAASDLLNYVDSLDDPIQLLILHTHLEAAALDQFRLFIEASRGDQLSEIYNFIRSDEKNHVAAGLAIARHYLKTLRNSQCVELALWCKTEVPAIIHLDEIPSIAARLGLSEPKLASTIQSNFQHRCSLMFNSKAMPS